MTLLLAGLRPASADTTFDFLTGATSGFQASLSLAQDGFSAQVQPFTSLDPNGTTSPTWVQVSGTGLGIYDGTTGLGLKSYSGDGVDLDGSTQLEGLRFTFTVPVRLTSIRFADAGPTDDFNLTVDGTLQHLDTALNPSDLPALRDAWYAVNFTGTEFMIWVDGTDDDLRIAGIQVAAIPEPAPWTLLAAAAAGGAALRRRRAIRERALS